MRELVEQAPESELDGLGGLVAALAWLEPGDFVHVVKAIWLARRGDCTAAHRELEQVRDRLERLEADAIRGYCMGRTGR